jgi:hypothetical protein
VLGPCAFALSHNFGKASAIAGFIGGILSILWAWRARAGKAGRALPLATVGVAFYVFLSQTVIGWLSKIYSDPSALVSVFLQTIMVFASFALLMLLTQSDQAEKTAGSSPAGKAVEQPGKSTPIQRTARLQKELLTKDSPLLPALFQTGVIRQVHPMPRVYSHEPLVSPGFYSLWNCNAFVGHFYHQ